MFQVSGAQRGRERHAAPAADAHGGRLAARAQPPRPLPPPRPLDNMELGDVPRHRPLAFDKVILFFIFIFKIHITCPFIRTYLKLWSELCLTGSLALSKRYNWRTELDLFMDTGFFHWV